MKFAYLITAHEDTEVLHFLLRSLDDFNNDIFIHWDLKSVVPKNLNSFLSKSNLFMVSERYDVRWGHISQVQAEYSLFRAAFQTMSYDYYHLISSSDMPIKTNYYIQEFFKKNKGRNFIGFSSDLKEPRVLYKHICTDKQRDWSRLTYFTDMFYTKIQRMLRLYNKNLFGIVVKKGPNWVSVNNDFVTTLLKEEKWVINTFSKSRNPDEYYKQTIAYKCGFKDTLYDINSEYIGCMRFVDWTRGKPYCWHLSDIVELLSSKYLFCRKIVEVELAKEIYFRLYNNG